MGRRPIGKIAMTGAERMRRLREKHGTAPVTKPDTTKDREIAVLKARIAELEATGSQQSSDLAPSARAKLDAAKRAMERRLKRRARDTHAWHR